MKKAQEANINEFATKKDLAEGLDGLRGEMNKGFAGFRQEMKEGFEEMAGMMSRSFDKLGDEIHELSDDVKVVKRDVKDLQGRVSNIEVALRQDNTRITRIENHLGLDR